MSFKEVTNAGMGYWPKKATERKEGDEITGVYTRKDTRVAPDGSQSVLYVLKTKDGMIGVNSSAMIARAMEQIPEGSTVKIVYNGKARSAKTGREYNDFRVYMDDATPAEEHEAGEHVDLSNLDF